MVLTERCGSWCSARIASRLSGPDDHRRGEVRRGRDRLAGLRHVRRLELGHLLVDQLEPLHRVGHLHRQVVEQRRDPVVGNAVAVVVSHRDRHHRADHRAVGVLAAREQQLAVAAADRGEHDVVDRAAERGADRAHVVEARGRVGPRAVRADRALDRQRRRGAEVARRTGRVPRAAPTRGADRTDRVGDRARELASGRDGVGDEATPGVEHLRPRRAARAGAPTAPGSSARCRARCRGARRAARRRRCRRPCSGGS